MKKKVDALMWNDGRIVAIHDPEIPLMNEYSNPYTDIENAKQVKITVEVIENQGSKHQNTTLKEHNYTEEQLNMFEHFLAAKHLLPFKSLLKEIKETEEVKGELIAEKFIFNFLQDKTKTINSFLNMMDLLESKVYIPDEVTDAVYNRRVSC